MTRLSQLEQLDAVIAAATAARTAAKSEDPFASYPGLAFVNALHDLTGEDALYDLADNVRLELNIDQDGRSLSQEAA